MYLGLDLSLTGSGLCLIDNNYQIIGEKKLSAPGLSGVGRLYFLEMEFNNIISAYINDLSCIYCCIENPAYRAEGRIIDIGEWLGICKLNLYKKGIPFIPVAPSQLKKYILGKGVGNKTLILLDIFKRYKIEIRDDDIGDAYVLARICKDFHNVYILDNKDYLKGLPSFQKEVILAIIKTTEANKLKEANKL